MSTVKKCGIITLCGRPNVGKSTLTNALVGDKVAIVTNKPQTTRNRICGILTRGECQFVFVDTPGLHKARTRLGDYMVGVVKESVADVDAVVLLVEPIPHIGEPEAQLIARMKTLACPAVLVINKVDTLEHKEKLLEVIQTYSQAMDFAAVLPVSARTGEGVEELLGVLEGFLPEGPQLFPEDMTSDQPERQMMAEILRESCCCVWTRKSPTARRWRSPALPSGTTEWSRWRPPSTVKRTATRALSSAREARCSKRCPPWPGRTWSASWGQRFIFRPGSR